MTDHPRAGQLSNQSDHVALDALLACYETPAPNSFVPTVSFGTSGHRGSSFRGTFQAAHVAALTRAIVALRGTWGATGPLFVGADSHALSARALQTVRACLQEEDIDVRYAPHDELVATPVISHTILAWNRAHPDALADGIVLTPSHNPPCDGGFKYNPTSGGPASPAITDAIAAYANRLLADEATVRVPAPTRQPPPVYPMIARYVEALENVIDFSVIRRADVSIGVDPLGGASLPIWRAIRARYDLAVELLHENVDPKFGFMHLDHDGVIRMDCSSPWAMRGVVSSAAAYDVCVGHDPDADRHGIVTRMGVMNPNRFLSLAVDHLLRTRRGWSPHAKIGRTVVTTSMIDRVARAHERDVYETPVGFKWFVDGLHNGTLVFGGEESAGASFSQFDGQPWSTDKDGIIMGLLAAEMVASGRRDLDQYWQDLVSELGPAVQTRRDTPATSDMKAAVKAMRVQDVTVDRLAGATITRVATTAQGNGAPIGGVRLDTAQGWVAMRPSGTEDILKVYGESFVDEAHLTALMDEATAIVASVIQQKTEVNG